VGRGEVVLSRATTWPSASMSSVIAILPKVPVAQVRIRDTIGHLACDCASVAVRQSHLYSAWISDPSADDIAEATKPRPHVRPLECSSLAADRVCLDGPGLAVGAKGVEPLVATSATPDRDRVAGILADHVAQGRLELDEFADRVGLALSAGTSAELGSALADLPWRPTVPAARLPSGTTQAQSDRVRNGVWLVGGGAVSLLAGFGAVAAAVNYWWPLAYLLMVIATVTGVIAGHRGSNVRSQKASGGTER